MVRLKRSDQYVSFSLASETFAFDVANAREIVEYTDIIAIPQTPDWMRGVINLRGSVVPVLDLKLKFGLGETKQSVDSCILIVETLHEDELLVVGVLADAVREVFELGLDEMDPPPKFGSVVAARFIRGMGRRDDRLFVILEAGEIFSQMELAMARLASGVNKGEEMSEEMDISLQD